MKRERKASIPSGIFCGGNCSTCVYYEARTQTATAEAIVTGIQAIIIRLNDRAV